MSQFIFYIRVQRSGIGIHLELWEKKLIRRLGLQNLYLLYENTDALSFYRSQNVLCRSEFFEPFQKFDSIQCLLNNFCAGTKTNFNEFKLSFCLAQKIQTSAKYFWTSKRTRHLFPCRCRSILIAKPRRRNQFEVLILSSS